MEKLLGGRLYKAKSMVELAGVEHDFFNDKIGGEDRQARFDPAVCQCCGFREKPGVSCVCDGTDWYQLPNGDFECLPHRTVRAIEGGRRKFWDFGKRK